MNEWAKHYGVAYLDAKGVCARYSISISTLYKYVHDRVLPPPEKLGASARWSIRKLDEADEKRAAEGFDSTRAAVANAKRRKAEVAA